MIYPCCECKFWRFERIICGKMDVEKEHTTLIRRLSGSKNCGLKVISSNTFEELKYFPIFITCQWNGSSPTGPAEHWAGGSLLMSFNSLLILLRAIFWSNFCYSDLIYTKLILKWGQMIIKYKWVWKTIVLNIKVHIWVGNDYSLYKLREKVYFNEFFDSRKYLDEDIFLRQ